MRGGLQRRIRNTKGELQLIVLGPAEARAQLTEDQGRALQAAPEINVAAMKRRKSSFEGKGNQKLVMLGEDVMKSRAGVTATSAHFQ